MGFQPELARQADGLEICFGLPVRFLTGAVQFAMVCPAQWDREFVADLEAETAGLRKAQMMGIAGLAPANEARLFGHEPQVGLVENTAFLIVPLAAHHNVEEVAEISNVRN